MNTKSIFLVYFIPLFMLILATPISAQSTLKGGWKLHKAKGDLKVYTRPNSDSGIKEIRIITDMDCSIETFVMALNDVNGFKDWVYKTNNARLLKRVSPTESYYYSEADMPFPTSNRDIVVHNKQKRDKNGVVHSTSKVSKTTLVPKKKGIVRVTEFASSWTITPKGNKKVQINYQAKVNPGGSIPIWLVNMGISVGPIKTMEKLAKVVKKAKYQNPPPIGF